MRVKSQPPRLRESIPRILMVVVLPAPFGPIKAKTASLGTASVMPRSTDVPRNFLVSAVMRIGSLILCELPSRFDAGRHLPARA